MRKRYGVFAIFITIALIICGCGMGDSQEVTVNTPDYFIAESDDWFDNSLDLYSATSRPVQLLITEEEDALAGGAYGWMLSQTGAAVFKKHLFSDSDNDWDEIVYLDESRVPTSKRLTEGIKRQTYAFGGCAGSDDYVAVLMDATSTDNLEDISMLIVEYNEQFEETGSAELDFISADGNTYPVFVYEDKDDYIHLIVKNLDSNESKYYIVSKEGMSLYEKELVSSDEYNLLMDYDGSILLRIIDTTTKINPENGAENVLTEFNEYDSGIHYDENRIVYANMTGVFFADYYGENCEEIYHWSNHGEIVFKVDAITVCENGSINVLYENADGKTFINIAPTMDNIEVQTIEFAVSSIGMKKYKTAVAKFNRLYPSYRIELVEYSYDDSKYLVELINGQGPVLIDSSVGDFEEQKDYWEPLDGVFSQIVDESLIVTKAEELGKIDGTLYGIVTDFSINVLVKRQEDIDDWNYNEFIEYIDKQNDFDGIFTGASLDSGLAFVQNFFIHDMYDSYLFDISDGKTYFDTSEFRKIMHWGKEYQNRNCDFEQLMNGSLLCMEARINKPQQVAFLRVLMEDKLGYMGYPSANGSSFYITADAPVTVRSSATDSEKQIAYSFLKMLLSHDGQLSMIDNTNFNMSVRWDVLDTQIKDISTTDDYCIYGFPQIHLEESQIDYDADAETIYKLIGSANPKKMIPKELRMIIIEELDSYFDGGVSEDIVINNLESRVGLYLAEHN